MILYLSPKVLNLAFFFFTPSLFASHFFLEMGLFLFCKSLMQSFYRILLAHRVPLCKLDKSTPSECLEPHRPPAWRVESGLDFSSHPTFRPDTFGQDMVYIIAHRSSFSSFFQEICSWCPSPSTSKFHLTSCPPTWLSAPSIPAHVAGPCRPPANQHSFCSSCHLPGPLPLHPLICQVSRISPSQWALLPQAEASIQPSWM